MKDTPCSVMPAYKTRTDGDPLCRGDHINLRCERCMPSASHRPLRLLPTCFAQMPCSPLHAPPLYAPMPPIPCIYSRGPYPVSCRYEELFISHESQEEHDQPGHREVAHAGCRGAAERVRVGAHACQFARPPQGHVPTHGSDGLYPLFPVRFMPPRS